MDPAQKAQFAAANASKKAFSLLDEFKSFAFKGNVVDLAVGVIIGAAFGKIVDSLVSNLIMPALSYITPGEEGYKSWMIGRIQIGEFLGTVLNFLIVALALYIFIVKFLGWIMKEKKKEESPPEPVTQTQEEVLLTEIRDLLKQQRA